MAFSVQEVENIFNAALDYHWKMGDVKSQTKYDKPFYKKMKAKMKTFPGGKENITRRVKGIYTTSIQGFSHDDGVSYANPANIRTAVYPWKLLHAGITFTMHELLKDGISITDTATGTGESRHSEREKTALANLLDDKLEDMVEGWDRSFSSMLWQDGTQDATVVPGVASFISTTPSSAAVVGGIDQVANTWWRNRASLGLSTGSAANQVVVQKLQYELRQLRRYGGNPDTMLAGSDFMDWFEQELRSKGNYTLDGWAKSGKIDASVADLAFKGIEVQYEPELDNLSRAKYCYVLDSDTIYPMVVEGENLKKHNPARPENKYVFYRAVTWVGGLVCDQRNANGVYSIA